jgi:hypothetical protein
VLRGQLERVDHAQDLAEVAAGGGRIGERQLDLLVGADHEHRADGHRVARVRVDHPVQVGHLVVGIRDEREIEAVPRDFLDVVAPGGVVRQAVDAEPDDAGVALVELGLQGRDAPELRRADRREICGVGEEDAPSVAEVLVKVDFPFGGVRGEVRGLIAELKRHVSSS